MLHNLYTTGLSGNVKLKPFIIFLLKINKYNFPSFGAVLKITKYEMVELFEVIGPTYRTTVNK